MRWTIGRLGFLLGICVASPVCAYRDAGAEGIELYVDVASFANFGKGDSCYVEVYRMIGRDGLRFEQAEDGLRARFRVEMSLVDLEGRAHAHEVREEQTLAGSPDEVRTGQFLFGASGVVVRPGTYVLRAEVADEGSGVVGAFEDTIVVRGYDPDLLSVSDLELAVSIEVDSSRSELVKNGRKVVPNPLGAYGPEIPMLYVYSEIYGLSTEGTYTTRYFVFDSYGECYKSFPAKTRGKPGTTSVDVGGINVAAFPPGGYTLCLTVMDDGDGRRAVSKKRFWVWPSSVTRFTEEEAARIADEIEYIASSKERNLYDELDLTGKAEFARRFWARRDPTPGTLRNEAREEHYRRLVYAERHFKGPHNHRERIYIVYGSPDDIERHPQSMGEKPYEIWHYFTVEGGVLFVFVDLHGFGQYRLLHSTARGEMSDPEWERWIRISE